ncbi:hypothetical protein Sjap_000833 [Stephania japonica]|uniref:SET domain-containing protein n=1 Tax=Stephania japonica TaxID=461633 RepID=A0AAP0PQW7_9MAGN
MPPAVDLGRRCARALSVTRWFSATTTSDYPSPSPSPSPSPPLPPPIRVALTESAGRGVFATRRIGAGDLLHTAEPLVAHPSLSLRHSVCYFCLRNLKSETNSGFCSDECIDQSKGFYEAEKKIDWSAFDDYCRTQGLKYPLLVKRLACMVMSGEASAEILDILQPARLQSETIIRHVLLSSLTQMEEESRLMRSTFSKAGFKDEQMNFLTKQWYTGVLARIRINAFRVELIGGLYEDLFLSAAASVDAGAAVGNAVYMLPSFYNHDCDPNVHILWIDNTTARLKALREIEAGEELRICYIDASMDHDARNALLFNGFGFVCNCLRCSSGD